MDKGHKFLEVGLGSGYGTALAREIVGHEGFVVSIEIDPLTFEFARKNLENLGYRDIILVKGEEVLGIQRCLHMTGSVSLQHASRFLLL